jgi:hypothetical protein
VLRTWIWRRRRWPRTAVFAESARGISPRAAHRSVRKPLDLYGSCHRAKAAAFRNSRSVNSRCDAGEFERMSTEELRAYVYGEKLPAKDPVKH